MHRVLHEVAHALFDDCLSDDLLVYLLVENTGFRRIGTVVMVRENGFLVGSVIPCATTVQVVETSAT